ncbi:hypothetical protein [Bosea sp. (in: a-proteobacteria)]|uniref:hypothetical protein n=1 Tax=Bosea sp. (in: a-proteobacteria) TaxID=1871050 RepID=UPI002733B169|nr:hypothetical protein [Bosea sp. (in: a-proteobacteria)]MDP3256047.1 hypothetical protein [Bosea sp. (in: a-proteobacteria)]
MRAALLLLGVLVALPLSAAAVERLDGEAIRRAFEGNTVSGRYTNGGFFTEFHDPDGRALGHNGWQPNRDACWTTRADQVCYYYGPQSDRTVHCFTVELNRDLYILRNAGNGQINALASVELGNPRKHGDHGEPWYCDGLISKAPEVPMTRRRLAAR